MLCNVHALHIPPEALASAFPRKVIVWDWPEPMANFGPVDEVRPT